MSDVGSFWASFGRMNAVGNGGSTIDDLLEKDTVVLEEILEHDEVINECKYLNLHLIE